ncbi:MAG TPA: hypothetical protein VGX21_03230 [Methylomirabilota bacterium]|jgi:hypothetical protein|nr:hypothetical protein [Methylomirabilota bacterium]
MAIIRFNQWKEFLDELAAERPPDGVVRLTFSLRYDGRGEPHLTLVAGYLLGDTIRECVEYLGLQPTDPKSQRAQEIEQRFRERKTLLEVQGYTVKAGRFHVPPSHR